VRSLLALFRSPRWLAGFLTGIGGWVLYVAALRLAPLSLVQAASAGGIGVLALLVSRGGVALSRSERSGVAVSLVGLVLLGISLAGGKTPSGHGQAGAVALWIGVSAAAALVVALPAARLLAAGAGLGAAAGILYAAGDVGTKAAVVGGQRLWFVPLVLACHGAAFVALQLGFQRGSALATAGLAVVLTNALPIAAGALLFGESLPGGALGAVRVLAFAAVVAGAGLLARPEAPAGAAPVEEGTEPLLALGAGAPLSDPADGLRSVGPVEHEALRGAGGVGAGGQELGDDASDRSLEVVRDLADEPDP
jgi:hypothetical protein